MEFFVVMATVRPMKELRSNWASCVCGKNNLHHDKAQGFHNQRLWMFAFFFQASWSPWGFLSSLVFRCYLVQLRHKSCYPSQPQFIQHPICQSQRITILGRPGRTRIASMQKGPWSTGCMTGPHSLRLSSATGRPTDVYLSLKGSTN